MYEIIREPLNGIEQGAHCLFMPLSFSKVERVAPEQVDAWIASYKFPADIAPHHRETMLADANLLLPFVTEKHAALILDLLFAYYTESDAVKKGRQDVIDNEFQRYLGTSWQKLLSQNPDRFAYRIASMNTVPDALLRDYVACIAVGEYEKLEGPESIDDKLLADKLASRESLKKMLADAEYPPNASRILVDLHQSRSLAEHRACLADVQLLLQSDADIFDLFAEAMDGFSAIEPVVENSLRIDQAIRSADARARLLNLCVNRKLRVMDGVSSAAAVSGETIRRHQEAARATFAAAAAGRNLGAIGLVASEVAKLKSQSRQHEDTRMLAILQKAESQRLADAKERLRRKLQAKKDSRGGKSAQTAETPDASADADQLPVYAWSVSRLVEWIDGAPSELKSALQRKPKPADPVKPTAQRNKGAAKPKQPSKTQPKPLSNEGPEGQQPEEDQTVNLTSKKEDVKLVVQSGLRQCARFLLDDVREMSQRAQALAMLKDAKRLGVIQEELNAILNAESVDPSKAAEIFDSAEKTTRLVRQAAKKEEASLKFFNAFPQAVAIALKKEDLRYNKRTGGIIDARNFRDEYWGTVNAEYHGRCLNIDRVRTETGEWTQLREHEALAFYVTGSSLSGYPFDISVHLWRRRRGKVSIPANEDGFMNDTDWYDTLIPYCVLHVGLAK